MSNPRRSFKERGYDERWRRERVAHLRRSPLCVLCEEVGRTTEATVVDHIKPHRGEYDVFWDVTNWQSLCKSCHSSQKQHYEATGHMRGHDGSGLPLDPGHPWAKG